MTADALRAICEIDLSQLEIEPPRGKPATGLHMRTVMEASIRRYCFGGVVDGAAGVVAGGFVAVGAEGSIFNGVVDGAAGVVAGGFVAAGTEGSMVLLRDQNSAATITTTITAKIAYQKRLSPKKFIATSLNPACAQ